MTTEDERRLQEYVEAARGERAPEHLADQVLSHVSYRERLEQRRSTPRPPAWLTLAGIAAALAAGWSIGRVSQPQSAITAENPPLENPRSAGAPSAPTSAAPRPIDPCQNRVIGSGSSFLLDDFEDGDDAVAPLEGRQGVWRWARETDAPGTAPALIPVPRSDATARNRLALHVRGARLDDWGATIELDFRPRCYDATRYAGVSFQASGPGRVYLALRQVDVIPIAEGGICERDCHNPHLIKLDLTADFQSYAVRWSEVRQRGINRPPLDPSRLHSIALLIRPEDTPYDVWLDDVRFLPAP